MVYRKATELRPFTKYSVGLAIAFAVLWTQPALAAQSGPLKGDIWAAWNASPLIVGGCLMGLIIYLRGFVLRWASRRRVSLWRAASYISGLALTYIALQSPLGALSDRIFWIDRLQHAALHVWIPVLLALSAPVPELVRGLPRWARRCGVGPVLRNRGVRKAWRFLQHPIVAPILFVGLIYLWLTPVFSQYAAADGMVYDVMYASLFIEGSAFWWLILNPKCGRVSYGRRIVILWLIMPPQMLLGFYLMFTSRVLYPFYVALDRGWVMSYLIDQNVGGMVVWIPSIMVSALTAVIVLRFWMHQERRGAVVASSVDERNHEVSSLALE